MLFLMIHVKKVQSFQYNSKVIFGCSAGIEKSVYPHFSYFDTTKCLFGADGDVRKTIFDWGLAKLKVARRRCPTWRSFDKMISQRANGD